MDELTEYGTVAYTECLNGTVKLMTKRGVNKTFSILAKSKAPFGAPASSAQIVRVEVPDAAPVASED